MRRDIARSQAVVSKMITSASLAGCARVPVDRTAAPSKVALATGRIALAAAGGGDLRNPWIRL